MTDVQPTAPPLLTAAERAALREVMPGDHPLVDAAIHQGDQLVPFLTQLATLLRAGQAETALAALDAALAPLAALDANADGLVTTLATLSTAWTTFVTICPDGTLPVGVLADAAALRAVAEAAQTVSDQAQEIALRAADRARLLDARGG